MRPFWSPVWSRPPTNVLCICMHSSLFFMKRVAADCRIIFHYWFCGISLSVGPVVNANSDWSHFVPSILFLAERLWRPPCMPGRCRQGYRGSECPRPRLCSRQPAWHLHQCAFLHTVDIQSLQILPQPWVGQETLQNQETKSDLEPLLL